MSNELKRFFRRAMALAIAGTLTIGTVVTAQAAGLKDVFDPDLYAKYEDVTKAYGTDADALYEHYTTYGFDEDRIMTELIDVKKYREAYPDLDAAFGDDWDAYVNHYLTIGFSEGRKNFAAFDARAYADRYPDLKEAFGYDVLQLYRHYVEFGRDENRCATTYAPAAPAASSTSGSSSQQPETPAAPVEVTGRVVDPETGTSIPNATITARPVGTAVAAVAASARDLAATVAEAVADTVSGSDVSDGDAEDGVFTTTTDENGNYTLNLPAGTYTLTATAAGYMVLTMDTVVVNAGEASVVPTITLLSESADGQSSIAGRLTNALNGEPIEGVTVTLRSDWCNYDGTVVATATTDANGEYSFDVDRGYYTATYAKDGFVTKSQNVISLSNATSNVQNEALTPEVAADSYRIVLTWGETPRDLDSHITGPTEDGEDVFHVAYYNKQYINEAGEAVVTLDHDDVTSFGPETVTIITPQDNAVYRYTVHNFSGEAAMTISSATVVVYAGSTEVATYNIPVTGEGRYWSVFEIRDGEIVTLNTITDDYNAYFAEDLYTE